MPGIDRSGPTGMGSMTGRGLGLCNGQNAEDRTTMPGGFGRGGGRGCRRAGGFGQGAGRRRGAMGDGKVLGASENKDQLKARRERLRQSLAEVDRLLDDE